MTILLTVQFLVLGSKYLDIMSLKNLLALSLLSICAFITVSTEFTPLGIMSTMSSDLQAHESQIGFSVTIYAWVGTAVALITPILFGRINRKIFLTLILMLIGFANFITAMSESIMTLYIARFIGGFANGAFLSLLAVTACLLVQNNIRAKATAIVFLGVSFASSFCVPIVNILNNYFHWREIYTGLSIVAICSAAGLLLLIPAIKEPVSTKSKQHLFHSFRQPNILALLIIASCTITAHFTIYSFIQPWLSNTLHLGEASISMLLLCFGLAGFISNMLLTKYIDTYLRNIIMYAIQTIATVLLLFILYNFISLELILYILFFVWGASISSLIVCFQAFVIQLATDHVENAVAIYVSIFNTSIGLGALLGSFLIQHIGIYLTMGICCGILFIAFIAFRKRFIILSKI